MQVQHERSLLDASQAKVLDTANKSLDTYCLQAQLSNSMNPIEHMAVSPSSSSISLLACHLSQTNQVQLFDMRTRKRRDKFPLKAYDKKYSRQSFQVSGMDFSPDGQRLAIGQTDCVIYIYKLATSQASPSSISPKAGPGSSGNPTNGSQQEDQSVPKASLKPTITGKFSASSPITCMRWSELGIIFGSQDGRVRLILSFNKPVSSQLDTTPSQTSSTPSSQMLNPANVSQNQSPKVMNLLTSAKKGSIPISLAYQGSILVVSQTDGSVSILQLASGTVAPVDLSAQTSTSEQQGQLLSVSTAAATMVVTPGSEQSNPGSMARRSSSVGGAQSLGVTGAASFEHSCPAEHLLLIPNNPTGQTTICCSGSDGRVNFHLLKTPTQPDKRSALVCSPQQAIDLNEDVVSMDYSSVNEVLVLAGRNRLVFVKFDQEAAVWRLQPSTIELRNVFTLASVRWMREGGHLAVGCSSNSLELFKCVWSKQSVNDNLDICHIARNRIRITDRGRNLLATYKTQADIKRVNLLDQGQNVVIWTTGTILIAKLGHQRLQSEIKWRSDQKASSTKFLFDSNSTFVLIHDGATNELSLLKLGQSSLSFTVKFPPGQRVRRHLVSVGQFGGQHSPGLAAQSPNRLRRASSRTDSASQRHRNSSGGADLVFTGQPVDETPNSIDTSTTSISSTLAPSLFERFAYVLPASSSANSQLNVIDLLDSNRVLISQQHAKPIEWIAFSCTGRYLAYRCASNGLGLLSFGRGKASKTTPNSLMDQKGTSDEWQVETTSGLLLESCDGLAQWLPGSDSLVAQSGPNIHVWYDLFEGSAGQRHRKASQTFDARAFNYINRRPLIDLCDSGGKTYPTLVKVLEGDDHRLDLVLSNGRSIELDRFQASFYAKLAVESLEEALELLESWSQTRSDELQSIGAAMHETRKQQVGAEGQPNLRCLYAKLGWLALEREGRCQLAMRAFAHLDYRKLVKFLERCLGEPDERQRELQLAKLRADWTKFELLAEDPDEIVATYRRLNKWLQLIDYLARRQLFRQRDLAEQDQLQWLIGSGRRLEAARLSIRLTGNLQMALELLLESGELEAAADLLLEEQRLPLSNRALANELASSRLSSTLTASERKLRDLVEFKIRDKLLEAGQSSRLRLKAAEISDKILGEPDKALELYLNESNFALALDLMQRHQVAPNQSGSTDEPLARIKQVELRYADFMRQQFLEDPLMGVSRKRATKCIDLYVDAGQPLKALQMANLLRMPERGFSVLESIGTNYARDSGGEQQRDELLDECNELGWQLVAVGQDEAKRRALLAFERGEQLEQLAELLLELKEFDRAFKLVLEQINNQNRALTEQQFVALADELWNAADRSRLPEAELIYVLANRSELAIGMYEQMGEHDKMLELVERHQVDQLEGRLLQLARALEAAGQLEEAEKYLLRASAGEWTNVVRMYRLAKRWPDAFRVARANCISERDPLLVQLAYWWANSIQTDSGQIWRERRSLLNKLGLTRQVVEFCCETKNFPFALELLSGQPVTTTSNKPRDESEQPANSHEIRREVVLRYATFLEQQQRLDQAERLLVENNLIELAVKMYADNDDHKSAIRVIETQLAQLTSAAAYDEQPEASGANQQALNELLNATLVECARRLVADVTSASSRGAHLMSRPQSRTSTSSHPSNGPAERLQAAQQMFLRAQRPDLAVDMYQSLGMWREAIQVAQRFAPRLLEGVERALDQLVSDDLGPILAASGDGRETPPPPPSELQAGVEGRIDGEEPANEEQVVRNKTGELKSNGVAPEVRAWRQFESNLSQGKQLAASRNLASYLGQLLERPAVTSNQLRPLERLLAELRQKRSPQANAILSDHEIGLKLLKLADRTLGRQLDCFERTTTDESRAVWLNWRNILASFAKLLTGSMLPSDAPDIERRLLAFHFVLLHCGLLRSLQKQSAGSTGDSVLDALAACLSIKQLVTVAVREARDGALDLLAKVSFSLLRYADLIDANSALWLAGLWQLASGRHQMARTVWTLLVELTDRAASGGAQAGHASELMRTKLGQFVDVPERIRLGPAEAASAGSSLPAGQRRLNQVRQWLLESLIEGDLQGGNELLSRGWARLESLCCLASGLPAASSGGGGGGANQTGGTREGTPEVLPGARERRAAARCDELLALISLSGIPVGPDRLDGRQLTKLKNMQDLRQLIGGEVEERRRRVSAGSSGQKTRKLTGPDQLVEIIDFLLGL